MSYNRTATVDHFALAMAGVITKIFKRKHGDSKVESEELANAIKTVEIIDEYLKATLSSLERQRKSLLSNIEDGRVVGDSLIEFANELTGMSDSMPDIAEVATCLRSIGENQRRVEDSKSSLDSTVQSKLYNPLQTFLKNDLAAAHETIKKYKKTRAAYENAVALVQKLSTEKKVNLPKLAAAQQEQETLKDSYDLESVTTLAALREMISKFEHKVLDQLVVFTDAYHEHCRKELQAASQLVPMVKEQRDKRTSVTPAASNGSESAPPTGSTAPSTAPPSATKSVDPKSRVLRLTELIISEKKYAARLSDLVRCQTGIRADEKLSTKIFESDVKKIFSNIEEIKTIHEALVADLLPLLPSATSAASASSVASAATAANELTKSLAEAFGRHIGKMSAYTTYVANFSTAIDHLVSCKKVFRNFSQFLKAFSHDMPIEVLLAAPLERLTQYELSFDAMLVAMATDESESAAAARATVESTVTAIRKVAEAVAASVSQSDRLGRLISVKKALVGFEENLVEEGRQLLRDGPLVVVSTPNGTGLPLGSSDASTATRKLCYFFLFNDMLLMTKRPEKSRIATLVSSPPVAEAASSGERRGTAAAGPAATAPFGGASFQFLGKFGLNKAAVRDVADSGDVYNAFEILLGNRVTLIAAPTHADKCDWLRDLNATIARFAEQKVFGVPLAQAVAVGNQPANGVPVVVERALKYLDEVAMETEGLFRLSGSQADIEALRDAVDYGEDINFPEDAADHHTVAGLVKLFFREMPEPLLTWALYDQWLMSQVLFENNKEGMIAYMRDLVGQLPHEHRCTLAALMGHFTRLRAKAAVNKMEASNLAICIGPNILARKDANPFDCTELQMVYGVVAELIVNYDQIFADVSRPAKAQ